jgi:hypothetical protein
MSATALSFYDCPNGACPYKGTPRQVRELVADGQPLFAGAVSCAHCSATLLTIGHTEIEEPEVSVDAIRAFVTDQVEQRARGQAIDETRLAEIQAALVGD